MDLKDKDKLEKFLLDNGYTLGEKYSNWFKTIEFEKAIQTADKDIELVIYGEFDYKIREKK